MSTKDDFEKEEGVSSEGESCTNNSCGCGCGSGCFSAGKLLIIVIIVLMAIYYVRMSGPLDVPAEWSSDLAAAQVQAGQENKHVLLAVHTSWCNPCNMMKSDVYPTSKFKDFASENLVLVMLDGDRDQEKFASFGVTGYPYYVVLTSDGVVKESFAGYREAPEFISVLKRAIK